ncbi:transposable element Tcb2 transposase [Trichonephila clavipes]|nr:transposable element Tcb2 transposase [Trichonephila clavipes]
MNKSKQRRAYDLPVKIERKSTQSFPHRASTHDNTKFYYFISRIKSIDVLGPVDLRDVIYTKTRLRTTSTDQSSRRPPHRKKCTCATNCFIGCHPGTGSTFTKGLLCSRTIRRRLAEGHLGSWCPLRLLPLTPTHRCLRMEWCRARGNWTAAEWNQVVFSDESRFNFSSDDNRVREWRPRGERLNLELLYSDTPLPQLV